MVIGRTAAATAAALATCVLVGYLAASVSAKPDLKYRKEVTALWGIDYWGYRVRNDADILPYHREFDRIMRILSGVDKVVFQTEFAQLPAPDFSTAGDNTVAILFGPRALAEMDKRDRYARPETMPAGMTTQPTTRPVAVETSTQPASTTEPIDPQLDAAVSSLIGHLVLEGEHEARK